MRKSEVYSWRLAPDLKARLEDAARAEQVSVSGLLEKVTESWLHERREALEEDERQRQLQAAAAENFGKIRGGDPDRSGRARETVRARIRDRRET